MARVSRDAFGRRVSAEAVSANDSAGRAGRLPGPTAAGQQLCDGPAGQDRPPGNLKPPFAKSRSSREDDIEVLGAILRDLS
jgi:hypothetical protein